MLLNLYLPELSIKERRMDLLHQAELERLSQSSRVNRAGRFAPLLPIFDRLFISVAQRLQKKKRMEKSDLPLITR